MKLRILFPLSLGLILLTQGCSAPLVVGGAVAGGAAVATDRRTVGTMVDDQSIELKAISAFIEDAGISKQAHVSATSYNGIVLLTGEAPTEALRSRATELVRGIPSVRQVHNEIALREPTPAATRAKDTWITSKVKSKLLTNEEVEGLRVKVVTVDGIVYLMGLTTREQARLASDLARDTDGVRLVVKVFEYID